MELTLIQTKIYEARGQKVMLDFDLANLSCRCLCLHRRLEFESSVKTQKTASEDFQLILCFN